MKKMKRVLALLLVVGLLCNGQWQVLADTEATLTETVADATPAAETAAEETPEAAQTPAAEETPTIEETPTVEETPAVEATPTIGETTAVEETPAAATPEVQAVQSQSLVKVWRDQQNTGGIRPDAQSYMARIGLEFRIAGGAWQALNEVSKSLLSLDVLPTPEVETSTEDTYIYTYQNLPETTADNEQVSYRFTQQALTGYVRSEDTVELNVTTSVEILLSTYQASVVWADDSDAAQVRPTSTAWENTAVLYRYSEGQAPADAVAYTQAQSSITQNDNTWTLVFEQLPSFNEAGTAYHYYLLQGELTDYQASVRNTGVYADDTERLYTDGTLINALTAEETEDSATTEPEAEETQDTPAALQGRTAALAEAKVLQLADEQVLTVQWNDNDNKNGSGDRPDSQLYQDLLSLQFRIGDEGEWITLSEDVLDLLGLSVMPQMQEDTSSESTWTYTYDTLPAETEDGEGITYRFRQLPVAEYISSDPVDAANSTTITNTATTTFEAGKLWLDNENAYETRPSLAEWSDTIVLRQYVYGDEPNPAEDAVVT
ncbi:MAG: Cna B-type domain-containing protein [Lachnospiraceae bacterium]